MEFRDKLTSTNKLWYYFKTDISKSLGVIMEVLKAYRKNEKEIIAYSVIFLVFSFVIMTSIYAPLSVAWRVASDPNLFLAAGKKILEGQIPYKDFWDMKGPFIFFFNALGCAINFPKGIWVLEYVLGLTGFVFLYKSLLLRFNRMPSLLATVFVIISLISTSALGNHTETWSLPFSFVALYIFMRALQKKAQNNILYFLTGLFCGIVMLIRINNTIIWVACIPVFIFHCIHRKDFKELFSKAGFFLMGFMLVLLGTFFYFYFNSALSQAIDGIWTFSLVYGSSNFEQKVKAAKFLFFGIFGKAGPFVLIILFTALLKEFISLYIIKNENNYYNKLCYGIFVLLTLAFLFMHTLSGRTYSHYAAMLLPALAFACAYSIELLNTLLKTLLNNKLDFIRHTLSIILVLVTLYPTVFSGLRLIERYSNAFDFEKEQCLVSDYIHNNSSEDDRYIIYGFGGSLLWSIDRPYATRFLYIENDLFNTSNELSKEFYEEYKEDLLSLPKFVITINHGDLSTYPQEIKEIIINNYSPVEKVNNNSLHNKLYVRK